MKRIARSLRQHRELILNYFRAQKLISSGSWRGLNNQSKVTMGRSYGFRTYRVLELPSITHLASCLSRNQPTISSRSQKEKAFTSGCRAIYTPVKDWYYHFDCGTSTV